MRTQLGNEQNNIDAYMKHRNMTEIILGMRKHVEKLMAEPKRREGPGFEVFKNLKYATVPSKHRLDPRFEALLKTQVFNQQKLAQDKYNTYWAAWSISLQPDKLWKELVKGAVIL
jgi:hypothetical protein